MRRGASKVAATLLDSHEDFGVPRSATLISLGSTQTAEYDGIEITSDHPATHFLEFWQAARQTAPKGALGPSWSAFDPTDHPLLLTWMVVFRRMDDGDFVCRVCGSAVTDLLTRNLTGNTYEECDLPGMPANSSEELDRLRSIGEPILMQGHLPVQNREHVLALRAVYPFYNDHKVLDRIVTIVALPETFIDGRWIQR